MTIFILFAFQFPQEGKQTIKIPASSINHSVQIFGDLGLPLGTMVTIQGKVIPTFQKGISEYMLVQRINGKATQNLIRIPLIKEFDSKAESRIGKSFEWYGYETGGFVGMPMHVLKNSGVGSVPGITLPGPIHHFRIQFIEFRIKDIPDIEWEPNDFIGESALLSGKAVNQWNQAWIESKRWKLLVNPLIPWPASTVGKDVEGLGIVQRNDKSGQYQLVQGTTRLSRLDDQVGKDVSLRGTAWSINGHWWFNYRGVELHVEDMDQIFRSSDLHGAFVEISGRLEQEMLPDIRQFTSKKAHDLKTQFILRKPSWHKLDSLLSPEIVYR